MQHLPRGRRALALIAASGLLATAVVAVVSGNDDDSRASGDTSPPPGLPATVSAQPLPTVQVNGIVWAQVTVGNVVYATGEFTHSRPPGAAPNTQLTPAGNILAYDITTGERIMSFDHTLDRAGRSMAVSADGSRVYVGGDFKKVDGVDRPNIVAFRTSDGAVDPTFRGKAGATVMGIVPTADRVYVGGAFVSAGTLGSGDIPRQGLAAYDLSGNLLPWAPAATGGIVESLVMAPGGTKVIAAGQITKLNGVTVNGMGAADAATGETLPWLANTRIKASHPSSVRGLSTDGVLVYGGATSWGGNSNFEGRFALNPADGSIVWANDCHGDTYTTYPLNGVLYSTGHAHDCSWVGSFPDYHSAGKWKYVMAESTFATGTNKGPDNYGWNYSDIPAAAVLNWFPSFTAGTGKLSGMPAGTVAVSGHAQAGWALTSSADGRYLAVGGEFTAVNAKAQQALTRFAMPSSGQSSIGPIYESVVAPAAAPGSEPGTVNLSWGAAWDRDSTLLTYEIFRDGAAQPITRQAMSSTPWQRGAVGSMVDRGLTAGPHSYLLKVTDPDGNWVKKTTNVMVVAGGTMPTPSGNVAAGRPTSASGLYAVGNESLRAVDGSTNGSPAGGSVTITPNTTTPWWQVDLTDATPISRIEVFGRTDCCTDQSADFWVFASDEPLDMRLTPEKLADRPGVWSARRTPAANPSASFDVPAGTTARYVMVRKAGAGHLSLAEVVVTGTPVEPPPPPVVDTLAPTAPGPVTATQDGTSVRIDWDAATDLPDPGGVGLAGHYVIRDYTTQWFVPNGTLTFTDTEATVGRHRYDVRAVDKGSRIGPAAGTTITVTDPNVVVDTLAPAASPSVTATQDGTSVRIDWAEATDLPDPGGVGIAGYFVIRDYTTQWMVPAGTLTFTDTGATVGRHRYDVRAVDKGSRIGPAAGTTITVTDPNAVVDTLAPTAAANVTVAQDGAAVVVTWTPATDLPDPGGVGVAGHYVIRDYTTQWFVPAGTNTFTDTGATPGRHRYQVRAVDKGSRIGPATPVADIVVG